MEKEKPKNQYKSPKYSYTAVSDNFLDNWSHVVGVGPTSLYLHLLKYCHKEKNLAWPTLKTLSKKMGVSERTLIRYRKTLVKHGFIQNIFKRNSIYRNNIYQMVLGKDLIESNLSPCKVTNGKLDGDKKSSCKVTNGHPNNNNLKHNHTTATKEKKEIVVGFKKLKEKGEEKIQAVKEQLRDLDFEESFMEKILKEFNPKKIEEKLCLLMERRNIKSPAGWLLAALKNDYQDMEKERYDEESTKERGNLVNAPGPVSRKKALEAIKLIRKELSQLTTSP